MTLKNVKKIMIIGDSDRGKTTLARKLSEKIKIRYYSIDDFYQEVKFSKKFDRLESIKKIDKIYSTSSWIVDGTARHLIKTGLKKSNLIIYLSYRFLLSQYYVLFKRYLSRKEETFIEFLSYFYSFSKKIPFR